MTNHATARIRERNGIPKKSAERIANIALEKGLKHSQLTGTLRKWADELYFKQYLASNMRLYGDIMYLFAKDNILITVIKVPTCLQNQANKLAKRQHLSKVSE